ncbi:MAG: hydroxymyristoyl-ACP dehydratase [Bacteroidales bacterium]|nr:hydroxymyristoyl-ACP dehydratase [Bacteroidales bacterium]MDE6872722.1 hydroxymyristoyl-ACP dehydratase [Bacteroidales bacterium]
METPLFVGEQIHGLIPQRPPIVMVDTLYSATETEAETGLHILEDNVFVEDGRLREPGLIEHVAQSAAAFAGYGTFRQGLPPKLGFIGEIKQFRISRLPLAGEDLRTNLQILGEAAGITLLSASTVSGDELLATCRMKIFIKED